MPVVTRSRSITRSPSSAQQPGHSESDLDNQPEVHSLPRPGLLSRMKRRFRPYGSLTPPPSLRTRSFSVSVLWNWSRNRSRLILSLQRAMSQDFIPRFEDELPATIDGQPAAGSSALVSAAISRHNESCLT